MFLWRQASDLLIYGLLIWAIIEQADASQGSITDSSATVANDDESNAEEAAEIYFHASYVFMFVFMVVKEAIIFCTCVLRAFKKLRRERRDSLNESRRRSQEK